MGEITQLTARDGHDLRAYVAHPATPATGVIVVIQEIFGVNSHIRSVADGFAADGYLAIAPAMFDRAQRDYEAGYSQVEVGAGVEIMKSLDWDQALLDVQAAIAHQDATGKPATVVGYCWGGAVAWLAATRLDGLACSVAYYGGAIPAFASERPRCPIMLHFGELDQSIPLDKAQAVAAAHPKATTYFYAGAGHGFNCDQRGSFDRESAETARARTLEFLRKHLG